MNFMELLQNPIFGLPLFIILGLVFGSFATMASYRLARKEDIFFKPSHCTNCNHRLWVRDLIPLVSWLINNKQCKYCSSKISIRYPLIEIATSILFTIAYLKIGIDLSLLPLLALCVAGVIVITMDIENHEIPYSLYIFMLVIGCAYQYSIGSSTYRYLSGIILASCLAISLYRGFGALKWKTKGLISLDEVKLISISGLFLGIKAFVPFILYFGIIRWLVLQLYKLLAKEKIPSGVIIISILLFCLLFPEYSTGLFYG